MNENNGGFSYKPVNAAAVLATASDNSYISLHIAIAVAVATGTFVNRRNGSVE